MNSINSLKQHVALSVNHEVSNICHPLYLHDIRMLNVIRCTTDGRVSYICDDYHWLFYYLSKAYPRVGQFEQNKVLSLNKWVPWSSLRQDDPILADSRNIFNICHGITIIRHHPNWIDYFCFGVADKEPGIQDMLLAKIETLQNFIEYFYHKAETLINQAQRKSFILKKFSTQDSSNNKSHPKRFYLGPQFNNQYLTHREIDCLKYLVGGKTISHIAIILGMHERTAEKHIENLKEKLCCPTLARLGYLVASLSIDRYW